MQKDEASGVSNTIKKGSIFVSPPFSFLYLNIILYVIYLIINEILVIGDKIQPYAAGDLIFSILVALLAMLIMGVFSITGSIYFVKEIKKNKDAKTKNIIGLIALNLIPVSILFVINYCWYPVLGIIFYLVGQ